MQGNERKQKHISTKGEREDGTVVDEQAENNAEKDERHEEKIPMDNKQPSITRE
jgi:hypothetical protein